MPPDLPRLIATPHTMIGALLRIETLRYGFVPAWLAR
jgi:hypothetical protein